MGGPLNPLETIGHRVSAALANYEVARESAIALARRRFLAASMPDNRRRFAAARYVVAFAALSAVLAFGAGFFVRRTPQPLAFTNDGSRGSTEAWIAAPGERAIPLAFSDGTTLTVEAASRARVIAVDDRGASVALENGAIRAHVVHRPKSAWRLIAGPLTVRVTGTVFDVRWSASTEEFSLSVKEGSVAVAGSVVGAEHPVRAGETLRVSVRERRLEWSVDTRAVATGPSRASERGRELAPAPTEEPTPASVPPSSGLGSVSNTPPRTSLVPAASAAASTAESDWRELARAGSLRQAFAAAEAEGFDAACRDASAAELLPLADGARLSGRPDRATQALLTLRKRFPSDPRRAAAAFALGKVAFDMTRDYAAAAKWFRTSIREQPAGSLTREASGRLVEALKRSGDSTGARQAGEAYLESYPNGPHADIARSVVR